MPQYVLKKMRSTYNVRISMKGVICTALKEQVKLEEFTDESVVGLRKAYGGTENATIRVSAEAAQKLLAAKFGLDGMSPA